MEEDAEHDGPIDPERGRRTRASENIGGQLKIDDDDGLDLANGSHSWTLGGPDAASFEINAANGQLMTKAALDHEAKSTYTVDVTVRDSSGEPNDSDRITVTIQVKDLDEKPETTLSGLTIRGPAGPSYAENDTGVVATYDAASLMADSATWSLEGDDAGHLMIEGTGRSVMLRFMSPPDYEMPMDMGMDNTYMVILKASVGTDEATWNITVTVTNDEDKGMVELSSLTPVVDVPLTATLMDPDGSITGETWQWSKSMTMDGVFTQIGGATVASYTPVAADDGYHLMVEVTYTDGYGTGKDTEMATTGMVTTVPDQPGEVSLSSMRPVVGAGC